MHVSHGYHVVESDKPWTTNSVVVQREHIQECELRFFGVFDHGIGEAVTNHMQSHFFDNMPQQVNSNSIIKNNYQDKPSPTSFPIYSSRGWGESA